MKMQDKRVWRNGEQGWNRVTYNNIICKRKYSDNHVAQGRFRRHISFADRGGGNGPVSHSARTVVDSGVGFAVYLFSFTSYFVSLYFLMMSQSFFT